MTTSTADPYEVLGVSRDATQAEIKAAYRRLAKEHHPDRNPGDAAAKERFQSIGAAYEILSDETRRAVFDERGTTAEEPRAAHDGTAPVPVRCGFCFAARLAPDLGGATQRLHCEDCGADFYAVVGARCRHHPQSNSLNDPYATEWKSFVISYTNPDGNPPEPRIPFEGPGGPYGVFLKTGQRFSMSWGPGELPVWLANYDAGESWVLQRPQPPPEPASGTGRLVGIGIAVIVGWILLSRAGWGGGAGLLTSAFLVSVLLHRAIRGALLRGLRGLGQALSWAVAGRAKQAGGAPDMPASSYPSLADQLEQLMAHWRESLSFAVCLAGGLCVAWGVVGGPLGSGEGDDADVTVFWAGAGLTVLAWGLGVLSPGSRQRANQRWELTRDLAGALVAATLGALVFAALAGHPRGFAFALVTLAAAAAVVAIDRRLPQQIPFESGFLAAILIGALGVYLVAHLGDGVTTSGERQAQAQERQGAKLRVLQGEWKGSGALPNGRRQTVVVHFEPTDDGGLVGSAFLSPSRCRFDFEVEQRGDRAFALREEDASRRCGARGRTTVRRVASRRDRLVWARVSRGRTSRATLDRIR